MSSINEESVFELLNIEQSMLDLCSVREEGAFTWGSFSLATDCLFSPLADRQLKTPAAVGLALRPRARSKNVNLCHRAGKSIAPSSPWWPWGCLSGPSGDPRVTR